MNEKTKENIQKIAEITHFVEESVWENDTQERQNYIENVLKSIISEKDFSYENVEHRIRAVNMLYCIDRDNKEDNDKGYHTIKGMVNNEKAIKFYEENKAKITKDIQNEAKDYGYSEEKLINMICDGQRTKNDNGYFQKIALARYSIYQTAQNFKESIAYGLSENDYKLATNEVKEYESKLTQKMFEIFNKYHKTNEDENQIIKLIEKGADVNAKAKDNGTTPLQLACGEYDYDKIGYGNLRIAECLIENGADVNAKDNDGQTALHSASVNTNYEIAKLLIENGAEVDAKNRINNTPLIFAQISLKEKEDIAIRVINLLIDNGADIEYKDNANWNALTYALDSNRENLAKALIERGAKEFEPNKIKNANNQIIAFYDKDNNKKFIRYTDSGQFHNAEQIGREIMAKDKSIVYAKTYYKGNETAISKINEKSLQKSKDKKKSNSNDYGMGI